MDTPMALSVEYWASAKIGDRGSSTFLSMELEATPPEKTTLRPGNLFIACSVAWYTAMETQRRA